MVGNVKPPFGTPLNRGHPFARGLVGCWLFNEGSGNKAYDSSGYGNHGTLYNLDDPPTTNSGWVAGSYGGGLLFDGVGDYVDCENLDNLKNLVSQLTIVYDFILLAAPTANYGNVITKGYSATSAGLGSWTPGINTARTGYFFVRDSTNMSYYYPETSPWPQIPLNMKMQMAHVFDGTRTYVATYQNGKLTASKSDVPFSSLYISPSTVRFCRRSGVYLNAIVSSAFIYNRALSTEEIAYLYANPYCMFDHDEDAAMFINTVPAKMAHYRRMIA
jgi:hypothetical protein